MNGLGGLPHDWVTALDIDAFTSMYKLDKLDEELDQLNKDQRIILVAGEFHSDVASAVLWLREHEIDVRCVRLRCFADQDSTFFLSPEVIIPLPEARDYIARREAKQQRKRNTEFGTFSLEKGNFSDDDAEQTCRDAPASIGSDAPIRGSPRTAPDC